MRTLIARDLFCDAHDSFSEGVTRKAKIFVTFLTLHHIFCCRRPNLASFSSFIALNNHFLTQNDGTKQVNSSGKSVLHCVFVSENLTSNLLARRAKPANPPNTELLQNTLVVRLHGVAPDCRLFGTPHAFQSLHKTDKSRCGTSHAISSSIS